MNWFKFNNKSSLEFKTLIVNELPSIVKPAEKHNKYDIGNKHGDLIVQSGFFSNTQKAVECTVKNLSEIDEIISWLRGSGEVVFSNQEDRYYKASIINQIPFDRIIKQYRKFIIQFECQPFGYLLEGSKEITFYDHGVINNIGNFESEPIISITGIGDVELKVGLSNIKINGVEDSITINTKLMEVYKGSEVQNRKLKGKFPIITPGENSISWSGNVTKVTIIPNWRCL